MTADPRAVEKVQDELLDEMFANEQEAQASIRACIAYPALVACFLVGAIAAYVLSAMGVF